MVIRIADMRSLPLREEYDLILSRLTEAARRKAQRFVHAEDRIRSASGALMCARGIGAAMGGAPYRMAYGAYGKPGVEGHPEIQFSLSHSGAMIVFAQASAPVGVDVEEIRDIDVSVFHRFLSGNEKSMIASGADPLLTFYTVWTVREAFAKETGRGLPLFEEEDGYRIDYDGERIFFHGKVLMFRTFPMDGHVISLCAEAIPAGLWPHKITAGEWQSLLSGR